MGLPLIIGTSLLSWVPSSSPTFQYRPTARLVCDGLNWYDSVRGINWQFFFLFSVTSVADFVLYF